jgi:hypothetical protein
MHHENGDNYVIVEHASHPFNAISGEMNWDFKLNTLSWSTPFNYLKNWAGLYLRFFKKNKDIFFIVFMENYANYNTK